MVKDVIVLCTQGYITSGFDITKFAIFCCQYAAYYILLCYFTVIKMKLYFLVEMVEETTRLSLVEIRPFIKKITNKNMQD